MLEVYGTLAAAAMVVFYALDERGVHFTFAFATSCGAAAVYALAIGSWPFFVLEAVWAAVAAHRGIRRLRAQPEQRVRRMHP